MKNKHNKKRNTAFIYEALARELSKAVLKKDEDLKGSILKLVKESFNKNSVLGKELQCYHLLSEKIGVDRYTAEKIIFRTKQEYEKLNKKEIFQEQSKLIKGINKEVGQSVFSNFIPNYKSFATIAQIFNDKIPLKQRILMESKILEKLTSSDATKQEEEMQPIDSHVLNNFVEKFNNKYKELLPEQRGLLSRYVMSFNSGGVDFKVYLGNELKRLYEEIEKSLELEEVKQDEEMRKGTGTVLERLKRYDVSNFTDKDIKRVLKIQKLVSEYSRDGN